MEKKIHLHFLRIFLWTWFNFKKLRQ